MNGKYAFYTRPQDEFIKPVKAGASGGACASRWRTRWSTTRSMIDNREYHTIKEVKNGLGPAPIRPERAGCTWRTVCGIRRRDCVTFCICCWRAGAAGVITHRPGGYFMAPKVRNGSAKRLECGLQQWLGDTRRMGRYLSTMLRLTRACTSRRVPRRSRPSGICPAIRRRTRCGAVCAWNSGRR